MRGDSILASLLAHATMSPIRGDVKKKFFPFLSEETDDVVACIQPSLSSGEAVGSAAYSGQTKQFAVCIRRFHDAMVIRRLRFWKLPQASLSVYSHLNLKERRRGWFEARFEAREIASRGRSKAKRWTWIRSHFISTVSGAAPVDGVELIRKRLPSRETAYWNRTIRGAMIRVWKRTWGTPATGSSCDMSIATAISFLSLVI
jgi:hypothetical protein